MTVFASPLCLPLFLPTLGLGELALLFLLVLILFGPGKLPQVAKALGEGIQQFKKATLDSASSAKNNLPADTAPKAETDTASQTSDSSEKTP